MDITQRLQIHFHGRERASVIMDSNAAGGEEKIGEIGLLVFFAIRVMSNLWINDASAKFGSILAAAPTSVPQFAARRGGDGVELVPYPGTLGRYRFVVALTLSDERCGLILKQKGFGFFGRDLVHYAPMAALVLLRHLAEKRADDAEYLNCLVYAATACAHYKRENQITLRNHFQLGMAALVGACGGYLDGV